jgi:hypothetical protein
MIISFFFFTGHDAIRLDKITVFRLSMLKFQHYTVPIQLSDGFIQDRSMRCIFFLYYGQNIDYSRITTSITTSLDTELEALLSFLRH